MWRVEEKSLIKIKCLVFLELNILKHVICTVSCKYAERLHTFVIFHSRKSFLRFFEHVTMKQGPFLCFKPVILRNFHVFYFFAGMIVISLFPFFLWALHINFEPIFIYLGQDPRVAMWVTRIFLILNFFISMTYRRAWSWGVLATPKENENEWNSSFNNNYL